MALVAAWSQLWSQQDKNSYKHKQPEQKQQEQEQLEPKRLEQEKLEQKQVEQKTTVFGVLSPVSSYSLGNYV